MEVEHSSSSTVMQRAPLWHGFNSWICILHTDYIPSVTCSCVGIFERSRDVTYHMQ